MIIICICLFVHFCASEVKHSRNTLNRLNTIRSSSSNIQALSTAHDMGEVPEVEVDLDQHPADRWIPVAKLKKNQINAITKYLYGFLGRVVSKIIKILIKPTIHYIPKEYMQEIIGIANYLQIDPTELVIFNVFYEIYSACTSIVAVNQNGDIFHVRNMDFGLLLGWDWKKWDWIIPDYLRNLTVNVSYKRNGQVMARAVHFAGYVGILTGSRKGAFSVSLNQRFALDGGYMGLLIQVLTEKRSNFIGMFLRETLLEATSYQIAFERCSTYHLIAPSYIVLSGLKDEGVVITRSRTKAIDIWKIDPSNKVWFVLQTNSDHWSPINPDGRKLPGYRMMNELGQKNLSFKNLYHVLDTIPLRNKLSVFTTIMSAKYDIFHTNLKYCNASCPPW